MYKIGMWNAELKEAWIEDTDYLLIAEQYVSDFDGTEEFALTTDELSPTGITVPCRDKSIIHIYRRTK